LPYNAFQLLILLAQETSQKLNYSVITVLHHSGLAFLCL